MDTKDIFKNVQTKLIKIGKKLAPGAAAAGAGTGAISLAGTSGLSAVGITTGLACLGAGSMLVGVGTVGLIGVGAYKLTAKIFEGGDRD